MPACQSSSINPSMGFEGLLPGAIHFGGLALMIAKPLSIL